jgi:hypothetical protein
MKRIIEFFRMKEKLVLILLVTMMVSVNQAQAQLVFCQGDSIVLDAGTYTGDLQWQESVGGAFFINIVGATSNQYKVYVTGDRYYRAKITNGVCDPIFSDTSFIQSSTVVTYEQDLTSDFALNTINGVDTTNDVVSLESNGVISLGSGSDGAFATSGDTALAGGVYNFTTFTVNAGDSLFGADTIPLQIFCTGTATINGKIYLAGHKGENTDNNMPPGDGGAGGTAGGYAGGKGGDGGTSTSATYHGQDGFGPGGGIGGITEYTTSNDGQGGGGGGYEADGGDSYHSGSGGGIGGSEYGCAALTTLYGGSGGGGGAADDDGATGDDGGGGGGGGGGAIKIVANAITVGNNGLISADGGDGGSCGNGGSGGGGSGGSIYLESYTITNNGTITAEGGGSLTDQYTNSIGGIGSDGRIRFDYNTLSGSGTTSPSPGYLGLTGDYISPGTMTTPVITPNSLCSWGELEYQVDTACGGVSYSVDVLDASGSTLVTNVASGTLLSTIPAVASQSAIRLKLTLTTSIPKVSPTLDFWRVKYLTK